MLRSKEFHILQRGVYLTLSFIFILWLVKFVEWTKDVDLGFYGILPRTVKGSIGIITGPLIHGDPIHLMSNTIPLIILGVGLFYFYHRIASEVFIWIYLASGFWVWIIGREAYHIGSSGLVYGLVMFIFWGGILRRNPRSLAISMIIFFLYGGMIYGLFPIDESVSWESHVMGSVAGIFLAFYFKKVPIYLGERKESEDLFDEDKEELNRPSNVSHTAEREVLIRYSYRRKS
jgi:membrane associated rhomboid family serine protease